MTHNIVALFFSLKRIPGHWVNVYLRVKTKSSPNTLFCWDHIPYPYKPLTTPTKSSRGDGAVCSRHRRAGAATGWQRAARWNIHTASFENITALFQRKKKRPSQSNTHPRTKKNPNPPNKNTPIIITIIKNPIRNDKEALRVWVLHSSSMLLGFFIFKLVTIHTHIYIKNKP